ncbi:hypothetical protein DFA_10485 [Cavenderia fasciculata]|uniref:Uncharacterized protein n=1 Tax=Cavenderia fasciculata TaxID=261658 RepID=F4QAC4_CACFS|nr:uncharacterized protein DFA_10485 [Cavenderia fasciculata]EGG15643.1 hypothetical protein DFA_10485 [Cavenderia fasciculata]|eukprot:XP_004354385.1 hypothetical protein DFA_10485 [Cavenderia fasciculata]
MLNETLLVRFVWSELPNIGFGADASLTPQTNPVAFSLLIPYCYTTTASLTGTNQPFIYVASTNLEHFYTNINNTRRMQYDYYPGLNDDFKALRGKLIDSTIQTPNIHNYNWCWLDRFDDGSFVLQPILLINYFKWIDINENEIQQTIIKTIPIGGIIPGGYGRLMVQMNLDFVPDLITLKLYSLDGTLHIGDVYTIRTSLINNNVIVEPIKLRQPPKNVKGSELFNQVNAKILANVSEAFIKSLQVKPNENSRSLILTNNSVVEKSSKKEVAPDYLIIFDDLSNELKDPSITKLMKIHFNQDYY